jgi:hypothetical protein
MASTFGLQIQFLVAILRLSSQLRTDPESCFTAPRGSSGRLFTAKSRFACSVSTITRFFVNLLWLRGRVGSPLARCNPQVVYFSRFEKPSEPPVPVEGFKGLWDCKITPPYCACQEGNTICCISSNDGLGAGVVDFFSTTDIHSSFTILYRELDPALKCACRGKVGGIF